MLELTLTETGTPASSVERKGFAEYSEEALRKGMRNFLDAYADKGLAMIATGNEPHGTGQKVLDIGCGKGFLLYEMIQWIPELAIRGIDISRYALEHAKEHASPVAGFGATSSGVEGKDGITVVVRTAEEDFNFEIVEVF